MRILQINCVHKYGSTGRIAAQISSYLDEKGVENTVAHGVPAVGGDSYVINSKIDAHLHSFLSRKLGRQGLYSHIPTLKLVRFIKDYDPDVVHLHNLHGHYLNYRILFEYLRKTDIKVVWTFHDCWPVTGKCAHFTRAGCFRWERPEGCHDCVQLSKYPDSVRDASKANYALKKKLFSGYPNLTVVTVSEWLLGIVKRSFLGDTEAVHIHNGIDTDVFRPLKSDVRSRLGLEDQTMILCVASIWNGQKGEREIIELAKRLPENHTIVLVGRNSDSVAGQAGGRIKAVPPTQNLDELVKLYSAADVFLSTSVEDSCPLVVMEAMACGTPVIVYNSTGLPENVKEGCGAVVEVGDHQGLLNAVLEIAASGRTCEERCRAAVLNGGTVGQMCEAYYRLYRKVLGEKTWD